MEEIKANNIHMLEAAYKELPETKRKYMGSLMNMRRVNDQARVIYRVKNKQWTQMEM
jgi:Txe/YoeB family toxin of Txe-Axe toxin-antitoxin module